MTGGRIKRQLSPVTDNGLDVGYDGRPSRRATQV